MTRPSRTLLLLLAAGSVVSCVGRPTDGIDAENGPETAPSTIEAPIEADPGPFVPRGDEVVDNFALLDETAEYHQLYEYDRVDLVVVLSFDLACEPARAHAPHVEELARQHEERVRFLYVDGNAQDRFWKLAQWKEETGATLPILRDRDGVVLPALGFRTTCEALVLETREWTELYRGRIRDAESGSEPLAEALEAALSGRRPAPGETEPEGTPLALENDAPVPDYAQTIVPILERRCIECHSENGIAPWAMSSHGRVRGWSPMIKETLLTKRMPPWFADPESGHFSNDRSLEREEIRQLVAWIDAGAPRGEGEDELPRLSNPERPEWVLGEPDVIVDTTEVPIPSTGVVPYLWWIARLDNTEDLWVRAAQVKPDNKTILHHAQIFIVYPDEISGEQPTLGAANAFAWYVPGTYALEFPAGSGKRIPPGAQIVFQLHYTTTGKFERDHPLLGLYLHDEPPPLEFRATGPVGWNLQIPPNAERHVEYATYQFDEDTMLYDLSPHMHFRGRSMEYRAKYPDGSHELLLRVPRYDFNWQLLYILEEPKLLPAGTTIVCRSVFDNSDRNPHNPNPAALVRWGLQSWDEMLIGNVNVHAVPEGWTPPGGTQ